jgi:adenylosuccinate lyase
VDLSGALEPRRFIGRAPEQVDRFIQEVIEPIRQRYAADLNRDVEELHV